MTFQYTSKSAGGAGTQGPAGPAGEPGTFPNYVGEYSNADSYNLGSIVSIPVGSPYGDPGQLFIRVSNPNNTGYPPGTFSWQPYYAGSTGPEGPQGPQGNPGNDGNNGSDGAPGPTGPQGDTGPQGAQGPVGATGGLSWTYKVNLTGGPGDRDPGDDNISFVGNDPETATQILVDDNPDGLNVNISDVLLSVQSGYLTLTSQTNPGNYSSYQITSSVDGTVGGEPTYVVFNVVKLGGYNPADQELVTVSLSQRGPQGPQGITVQGAIDDLTDVTITGTPADRQLIVYNTATSQWINADPIDAGGIAYKSGVPATPTSTGQVGQLAIDGINAVLYVCTSTNNWQKVSLNAANFTNAGGFA